MTRTCTKCSFELKSADPHEECVAHSCCLVNDVFDPRQCSSCQTLFSKAQVEGQAYVCWQSRLRRFAQLPNSPQLHPEADDFHTLTDPRVTHFRDHVEIEQESDQPYTALTASVSTNDVALKTLHLLERLDASLQ